MRSLPIHRWILAPPGETLMREEARSLRKDAGDSMVASVPPKISEVYSSYQRSPHCPSEAFMDDVEEPREWEIGFSVKGQTL